jgi:hypothetical protein
MVSFLALLCGAAGCSPEPLPDSDPQSSPNASLGQLFDREKTGTIEGVVTWKGAVPAVEHFRSPDSPCVLYPRGPMRDWPNPFAPNIDARTHGLGDVAVYLEKVDLRRSRPWSLPPVVVDQRGFRLTVEQGGARSRVGFVRRGEAVLFRASDDEGYALTARGDEFFALPFVEASSQRRTLGREGIVELSGSIGRFWMRGTLFVADHPNYARTDARGRFTLPEVPEGEYQLAVWVSNWRLADVFNDPGTTLAARVTFRPPLVLRQTVRVERGKKSVAEVFVSPEAFPR